MKNKLPYIVSAVILAVSAFLLFALPACADWLPDPADAIVPSPSLPVPDEDDEAYIHAGDQTVGSVVCLAIVDGEDITTNYFSFSTDEDEPKFLFTIARYGKEIWVETADFTDVFEIPLDTAYAFVLRSSPVGGSLYVFRYYGEGPAQARQRAFADNWQNAIAVYNRPALRSENIRIYADYTRRGLFYPVGSPQSEYAYQYINEANANPKSYDDGYREGYLQGYNNGSPVTLSDSLLSPVLTAIEDALALPFLLLIYPLLEHPLVSALATALVVLSVVALAYFVIRRFKTD